MRSGFSCVKFSGDSWTSVYDDKVTTSKIVLELMAHLGISAIYRGPYAALHYNIDVYDAVERLHPDVVQTSVNTTVASAAAADDDGDNVDDASQCDVVSTHPGHLLLISMGSCSATRSVFNYTVSQKKVPTFKLSVNFVKS